MAIQHFRVAAPTELPISVAEVKDELELIGQAHDSKITRHIGAARGIWERYTHRAAVPQQWVFIVESEYAREGGQTLVGTPGAGRAQTESLVACRRVLELPMVPVVSIDSVEYKDEIEEAYAAAVADTDYTVDPELNTGRVSWSTNVTLPKFRRIVYTAGYDAGELDAEYQETLVKLAVFLFENRGDVESKLPTSLLAEMKGQGTGTNAGYWS